MNTAELLVRRFDRFQQRHTVIAFPFAVVQKFGNDQLGARSALIAYYGLFSLFPLLLLFATILGFVLEGSPSLQHRVLDSALGKFPIVGTQLRSAAHPLQGSGLALALGIVGVLYGVRGVGEAAQTAMNSVWNIPYKAWPGLLGRNLRAFGILVVLGLGTLISTFLAGWAGIVFSGGMAAQAGAFIASIVVSLVIFFAAFMLLTGESLSWKAVAPGAILATVFWETLQALGALYVRHVIANATDVYGFFALVIGLLSWLYLGAELTLLAAEINVVLRYRLWPRSMTQPPFTQEDKVTFERLARMEERRPEEIVTVRFMPEADRQPLEPGQDRS